MTPPAVPAAPGPVDWSGEIAPLTGESAALPAPGRSVTGGLGRPEHLREGRLTVRGAAGMDVMISKIHTETSGRQILWISPLRPLFYCIC